MLEAKIDTSTAISIRKGRDYMARVPTGFRKRTGGGFEKRFTVNGVRYSVYGATIKECQDREQEKREQLKAGIYSTNAAITFDKYFQEWIAQKELRVRGATIAGYQSIYNCYISKAIGRCKIRLIERRQVVALMNKIAATGKVSAANFARLVICMVLKAAVVDDIVSRNVAENIPSIKRTKPPARDTIHRELTEYELKQFFLLAKTSLYYNAFRFLLYTGTRAGECSGLQWRDIDKKKNVVHIRRTITKGKDAKPIVGTEPKTKKSKRDIPINQSIRAVLDEQWAFYRDTHEVLALNDFVFPGRNDRPSNENQLRSVVIAILEKGAKQGIFIKRFGVHAFRDTFASRAVRAGIPPNTLKEILGHASLAMTMDLYAHVNQQDKEEGMQKMEAIDL